MAYEWTNPYYGVSHMRIDWATGFQFTVDDREAFVEATTIPLNNHPFTNATTEVFDTVAEAKAHLEHKARELKIHA